MFTKADVEQMLIVLAVTVVLYGAIEGVWYLVKLAFS